MLTNKIVNKYQTNYKIAVLIAALQITLPSFAGLGCSKPADRSSASIAPVLRDPREPRDYRTDRLPDGLDATYADRVLLAAQRQGHESMDKQYGARVLELAREKKFRVIRVKAARR